MVSEPVDANRLETPLNLTPPKDDKVEEELVTAILDALYAAKNPMILADILTARFHCTAEVRQLVDITQLPVLIHLVPANLVFRHKSGERDFE